MRKQHLVLVLLALLGLCASLGFPAEDVLDTTYDESEALPYESTPLYSVVVAQPSARITKGEFSSDSLFGLNSVTQRYDHNRENNTRSHRVLDSLTILDCSFRC